jgi:hypothetical protein
MLGSACRRRCRRSGEGEGRAIVCGHGHAYDRARVRLASRAKWSNARAGRGFGPLGRTRARARGRSLARLPWLLLFLFSSALLLLARLLTPSATGVGTHTQLGLPACGFLSLFHAPCPACGLTTALSHAAHGAWLGSLGAHPLGLPVFLGLLVLAARALVGWVRPVPVTAWLLAPARRHAALGFTLALGLVWIARLAGLR